MVRFQLNTDEKILVDRMLEKYAKLRSRKARPPGGPLLNEDEYRRTFTEDERALAERFLLVQPRDYGVHMPHILGYEKPPKSLVSITNGQRYTDADGKLHVLRERYLPARVFGAYLALRREMEQDIGVTVVLSSGYRTPRHQLLNLLEVYQQQDYRLSRALRTVAIPGRSQHCDGLLTALDFIAHDGTGGAAFAKTAEYAWLSQNAKRLGFSESYPKDNRFGISYEPWHWRYIGKSANREK